MPARRRAPVGPAPFEDATGSNRAAAGVVMIVVLAAFGGLVWNFYSGGAGREAPRIAPQEEAYKVAPAPDAANAPDPAEDNAMYAALESDGAKSGAAVTTAPAPEQPIAAEKQAAPFQAPQLGSNPQFVGQGRFVAQVAALQSEAAVAPAWQRLSSRAPNLFGAAELDVERADLGTRGIYYRVRAGYFADRANATLFCDRVKQMGQDCIVVAR